jgi:hypothetical protein
MNLNRIDLVVTLCLIVAFCVIGIDRYLFTVGDQGLVVAKCVIGIGVLVLMLSAYVEKHLRPPKLNEKSDFRDTRDVG